MNWKREAAAYEDVLGIANVNAINGLLKLIRGLLPCVTVFFKKKSLNFEGITRKYTFNITAHRRKVN